jgi:hypothetical protein
MPYLTRITFNSNHWVLPSGRHDKCPGANLFEAIHGFGFEEWWRNENFRLEKVKANLVSSTYTLK